MSAPHRTICVIGLVVSALALSACSRELRHSETDESHAKSIQNHDDRNEHQPEGEHHLVEGPHGGVVKPIGTHQVELVLGTTGEVMVVILGAAEKVIHPIPAAELIIQAQLKGQETRIPITLKATPLPDTPEGISAHFTGQLPESVRGKAAILTVTIPIGAELYSAQFEIFEAHEHHYIHLDRQPAVAMLERCVGVPATVWHNL